MRYIRLSLLAVVLATMLLLPGASWATDEPPTDEPPSSFSLPNPISCDSTETQSGVECVLNVLIKALWAIAIPLATLMILVGAFLLMTSQGNPEKIESGKKTITYAILGLVIIALASSVVAVVQSLLKQAASGD